MSVEVQGTVAPGYEPIARAFRENFATRRETGAAFALYRDGELVVDLWGGTADVATGRAWERDTTSVVFSATKGLVAVAFLMLEDRGLLDVDRTVASYWPSFGAHGKEAITVRQLLNHRAGLCAVDRKLTIPDLLDPERVEAACAAQVPLWEPGRAQGYGPTAWGLYTGVLFRKITGEGVGTWLRREVFEPLGADVHVGLPEADNARVSTLYPMTPWTIVSRLVPEMVAGKTNEGRVYRPLLLDRTSAQHRGFLNPDLGKAKLRSLNDPAVRAIEMPWMSAIGTARGIARVYAELARDGGRLVSPAAIARVTPKQSWSNDDRMMLKPLGFSQGFQKEEPSVVSPNDASFGHLGAGGSFGWCDPTRGLGMAYVMNRMDERIRSPRAIALCRAIYESVDGWI